MRSHQLFLYLVYCFITLLIGLKPLETAAHGGGAIQLADEPAGPYLITVWLSPPDVKAGNKIHISVGVRSATLETNEPVLDATVIVELMHSGASDPIISTEATTDQSVNKLLYETDMTVMEPGLYNINIIVTGSEGEGTAAFSMEAQTGTDFNWLPLSLIFLGLSVIILLRHSKKKYAPRN